MATCACAGSVFRAAPETAEDLYAHAIEDLEDDLYPEALEGFSNIKSKFPYSKFVALADLGIADVSFERRAFIEAVDGYRNFLKYHPTHKKASYAMYRIAAAYREQLPDDFWFLPPSAEKDQASTRLAISAYKDMIARFPDTPEVKAARKELSECRRRLADHELYVAEFYFSRKRWKAAAARAEGLAQEFRGLGLDQRALLIAAESRLELKEWEQATQSAARLQNEFPETTEARRARRILEQVEQRTSDGATVDQTPKEK